MYRRFIRPVVFAFVCGGTLLQTTTGGCNEVIQPILSSLASTVITSFISSLLFST